MELLSLMVWSRGSGRIVGKRSLPSAGTTEIAHGTDAMNASSFMDSHTLANIAVRCVGVRHVLIRPQGSCPAGTGSALAIRTFGSLIIDFSRGVATEAHFEISKPSLT